MKKVYENPEIDLIRFSVQDGLLRNDLLRNELSSFEFDYFYGEEDDLRG